MDLFQQQVGGEPEALGEDTCNGEWVEIPTNSQTVNLRPGTFGKEHKLPTKSKAAAYMQSGAKFTNTRRQGNTKLFWAHVLIMLTRIELAANDAGMIHSRIGRSIRNLICIA